jgi:hypothetical protein
VPKPATSAPVSFSNPEGWSQEIKDRVMKSGMGQIILNAVEGKNDE